MKSIIQIAIAGGLLLSLAAGCSSERSGNQEQTTYSGPGTATIEAATQLQGPAPGTPRTDAEIDEMAAGLGMLTSGQTQPAYDWNLQMLNGDTLSLSDFTGRVVILDFWDTWCPPCRRGIPELVELQNEYGDRGLTVVGMAFGRDGVNAVAQFTEEYHINYPVVMASPQVSRNYGNIRSIPTAFVVDQQGRLRAMHVGYTQKEIFEREIEALLPEAGEANPA